MPKKQIQPDPMTATTRKKLEWFILFYRFDTTVEEVEAKIYNSNKDGKSATHEYNQWRMEIIEKSWHEFTQKMLDMITEAWNLFPHKHLGGKSPEQMYIETYWRNPPSFDEVDSSLSVPTSVKIELNQKDYKTLLRTVAVSDYVYGIMSDLVDEKYKEDAKQNDSLIDKLLAHNTDPTIESNYRGKKIFSDIYMDEVMEDIMQFEDYNFWDLLVRKIARKISAKVIPMAAKKKMTKDEFMHMIFELEEKLRNDFERNELDNITYTGDL